MTEGDWKELQRLLDAEAASVKDAGAHGAAAWLVLNALANVADQMAKQAQE